MADDEASWPSIGRLQLDGFVYLRIATGPTAKYRAARPAVAKIDWEHQFGRDFGEELRWYFWVHILAGWFFTTMFVAGVTGLVRKD